MKCAIMGFGNPVRSDDGVGCYVAQSLKDRLKDDDQFSVFDMGTSAFEIIFKLKGHERFIIIDAVINSGHEDGTTFKLPESEINAAIQDDPMVFIHGLKWDQALSYAKKYLQDEYPYNRIDVYLISVTNTSLDIGLGNVVKEAGDKLADIIMDSIHSNV